MRCPKCEGVIPRSAMLFSDAFRGFDCKNCGTHLQATYLSRLALTGASLVGAVLAAQGLRAMGVGRGPTALVALLTLLGAYLLGAEFVPRLKVRPERPAGLR